MTKKEYIKHNFIISLILFSILYSLRIILTLLNIGHVDIIYYGIGIIVGISLEKYRARKVFRALDELAEKFEKNK